MQHPPEIRWECPRCEGDVPTKRSGHSFTETGNGIAYLFGGVTIKVNEEFKRYTTCEDDGTSSDFEDEDGLDDTRKNFSDQKLKHKHRRTSGPTNEIFRLDMSGAASSDGGLFWNAVESAMTSAPSPRWHHTANFVSSLDSIIIFGGFGELMECEGTCRLNDMWLFDIKSESWTILQGQDTQAASLDSSSPWTSGRVSKSPPTPRGAHATALVNGGDCLVVFGGYGGGGIHTRRDLGDLYVFHIPSSQWLSVTTMGSPPSARSGHAALPSLSTGDNCENLFIMGGWSASQQFDDVHVLENDGTILTWSMVATASGPDGWGTRRWNFGAVSVESVPNWKIFIFGGNSGDLDQMKPRGLLQNNVQVLDCGLSRPLNRRSDDPQGSTTSAMHWSHPKSVGSSPCPRSDTPIIYSKDLGKIIIFGGWSNRWQNDLFTCDVCEIVGPPYNIFTVDAPWGRASSPITGDVELSICGQGFSSSLSGPSTAPTAVVRFASSKGFKEVAGDISGDGRIVCSAPEFSEYDSDDRVEVTVKIGTHRFTNNALSFSYFSVTDASKTLAFGPGVLDGVMASKSTSFVI